jgi:hypothetical protein
MGGNAIKQFGYEGKRLNREEYWELVGKVRSILTTALPAGTRLDVIPSYHAKETFGDLDMLVSSVPYIDYRRLVQETFHTDQVHSNNNTHSFPVDGFQVDVIVVDPKIFTAAYTYFSWNDCGNLCGRVYHGFGLKYGHEGLQYVIRERTVGLSDSLNSAVLDTVTLSRDPKEILTFGGFSFAKFNKGFTTLEEMFDWVASSKYFNADQYNLDKLNHINRTRNRKRTSYMHFIQWLESNKHKYRKFAYLDDPLVYLPRITRGFPQLAGKLIEAKLQCEDRRYQKTKFNGDCVKAWAMQSCSTEILPHRVGELISEFKKEVVEVFGDGDFDQWVKIYTPEFIKDSFIKWFRGAPMK